MLPLLIILCFPLALLIVGFLYQWIGARRDRSRHARAGRWIKLDNGSELYLLEKGSGNPAVVFESGIAATSLNWHHIQETIAQFTRTASYDRAGLGWSGPFMTARTPSNIAAELHSLLEQAGIPPPYILVGHSFGGLVMRRFALNFPAEVAGMVLVDPMRLEEWPPLDPAKQATLDRGARMSGYAIPIARFGLARLAVTSMLCRSGRISTFLARAAGNGGRHVLARVKDEVDKMPGAVRPSVAAHWSRPAFYSGMSAHVASVPDSVREMLAAEAIPHIPILMLTPGKNATPLCADAIGRVGNNVQQVIARESAHWIHLDQPDLVIDAIREMVQAVVPVAVSR